MNTFKLFFIIALTLPLLAQTDIEKSILEAQDKRDASAIAKLIDNGELNNDKLLNMALIALANIADTSYNAVHKIMQIYNEQEKAHFRSRGTGIQSTAAFALGQIPCPAGIDFLRLIQEREANEYAYGRTEIFRNVLNSMGKIGDERDLESISNYSFQNDSLNGALALSIARFGMRKITNPAAIFKLKKLTYLIQSDNELKWVAFAFNRAGNKDLLKECMKEIKALTASNNPYCKMWAFSALGKTGDASYAEYIMKWYAIETDWRIKVNMLNSIGILDININNLNEDYYNIVLHSAVDDANPNVSITACQVLAKICGKLGKTHKYSLLLREYFEHYLAPGRAVDDFIQNEMIKTLAKIFKDDYKESLFSLFSQAEGYDRKSSVVSSFQYLDDPMVYKVLRDTISADVQRYNKIHPNKDGSMIGSPELAKLYLAFVETLSALDDKMNDENKNIIRLIFTEFSSSRNLPITDLCLTSLTDSMYIKYWEETSQILAFDFANFNEKSDKDLMLSYIQAWGAMNAKNAVDILKKQLKSTDYDIAKTSAEALKQITGNDYIKDITSADTKYDFDWGFINLLTTKKFVLINTEAGNIKIKLFPEYAPFTVQSFVKLGERRFFDGTVFHRVVPNFVIQGGDPTGTGFGGPGYSMRTEIADVSFEPYYVGMASSGKDTEGSQFFITHSPQPHLDGKYTIFGVVVDGFEAVDKIQPGNKVTGMTFSVQ